MVSQAKGAKRKEQGQTHELAAWSPEQSQQIRSITEEAWALDLGAIRLAAYTQVSAPQTWLAKIICAGFRAITIDGTFRTRAEAMIAAEVHGMLTLQMAMFRLSQSAKRRLDDA